MKQEWFESNDFVKTTSKNKPEEQAQEVADKAEETIADLDTPIEKNTQVEEEVSQAEVELENQQEGKETSNSSEEDWNCQELTILLENLFQRPVLFLVDKSSHNETAQEE